MPNKPALCFFCKTPEPRADARAKAVLCSKCVARLAGSPKSIGKSPKTEAERLASTTVETSEGTGKKSRVKKVVAVKKTTPTRKRKPVVTAKNETESTPVSRKKSVAKKTSDTGWGRGWHLKKHFVAPDGVTYSFGKPVED